MKKIKLTKVGKNMVKMTLTSSPYRFTKMIRISKR